MAPPVRDGAGPRRRQALLRIRPAAAAVLLSLAALLAPAGAISDAARRALLDPKGWKGARGGKAERWIKASLRASEKGGELGVGADTPSPTSESSGGSDDGNDSCLPDRYRPTNVTVKYNSSEIYIKGSHTWDGERFVVRGVGYSPIPPGKKTLMEPFDLFTSGSKPVWKRDIPLMAAMGANIVRVWSWDATLDHTSFLDYCHDHNLMVMLPFLVNQQDYKTLGDPDTHHKMLLDFKAFVMMVKNHPALFGYLVGNELNELYPGQMDELLSIVNAMAEIRNEVDDVRHPLTIPFSDNQFNKQLVKKFYPWLQIDFWSLQIYRDSIDDVLKNYTNLLDTYFQYVPRKPLVLTEYGLDALSNSTCERWDPDNCGQGTWMVKQPPPDSGLTPAPPGATLNLSSITSLLDEPIDEDQVKQAKGYCIRYGLITNDDKTKDGFASYIAGGVIMEYCDEWWKGSSADARRTECPNQRTDRHTYCAENINKDNESNAYYLHEEWLGLFRQKDPPDDRLKFCIEPRLAYYAMLASYSQADSKNKLLNQTMNPGVQACWWIANNCTGWMNATWKQDALKCHEKGHEHLEACQCKAVFDFLNMTFPTDDIEYCANMHLIWNNQYVMMLVPIIIITMVIYYILRCKLGRRDLFSSALGLGNQDDLDAEKEDEEGDEEQAQEEAGEIPQPSPTGAAMPRRKSKHAPQQLTPEQEAYARKRFDDRIGAELMDRIREAFWRYSLVEDLGKLRNDLGLGKEEAGSGKKDKRSDSTIAQAIKILGQRRSCPHFAVAQRRVYQMVFDVYMRMTLDPTQVNKTHLNFKSDRDKEKAIGDYIFPATRIVYEKYMEGYYLYKDADEPKVPFKELSVMFDHLALYTIVQTWAGTINHSPEKCCEVFDWALNWFPQRLANRYKSVEGPRSPSPPGQGEDVPSDANTGLEEKSWKARTKTVRDLHHGFVEIFRTYVLKVDQQQALAFSFDDVNSDALYVRKMQMKGNKKIGLVQAHPLEDHQPQQEPQEEQVYGGGGDDDSDGSESESSSQKSGGYPGLAFPLGGAQSTTESDQIVIGTEADLLSRREDVTGLAMTHGEIPLHKTHLEYNAASNPEESVQSDAARQFFEARSDVIHAKWFPEHIAFPQKGGIWALFLNFQWLIRYVLWQGLIASYLQPAAVSDPTCVQHFLMLLACGDAVWNWIAFLCHWRTLGRFKFRTKAEGIWTTIAMIVVVVTTLFATVLNSIEPDPVCQFLDGTCDDNKGKGLLPGIDVNVGSAYLAVAVLITFIDEVRLFLRTEPAYAIRGRFSLKKQYRFIRIGFLVAVVIVGAMWAIVTLVVLKDNDSPFDWWPGMLDQLSWVVFPVLMIFASWGSARCCGRCAGSLEDSATSRRDMVEEANYLVMNLIFWGIFFGVNWVVSYTILVPSVNNINWDMCQCDEREGILNAAQEDMCQSKVEVMCYVAVMFVWISAYLVAFIALYAAFEIELLIFGIARAKYVRVGNVQNWHHVESYWEQILRQCLPRLSACLRDERMEMEKDAEERRRIQGLCQKQEQVWNDFVESMLREHLLSDAEAASMRVRSAEDAQGRTKPRPNFRHKPKAPEARRRVISFLWGLESLQGHDGHAEDTMVKLKVPDQKSGSPSIYTKQFTSPYRRSHRVAAMPTWTTLVPTYNEAVLLGRNQLKATRDQGSGTKRITEIEYVALTHPAEWQNFADRIFKDTKFTPREGGKVSPTCWVVDQDNYANDLLNCFIGLDHPRPMTDAKLIKEIEFWASMRGQTLGRTILGLCNQREGLIQLSVLEDSPTTPFDHLQILRTVQRKYQILISHQTFDMKNLGKAGMEDHLVEMWRKLKYFDVVINDDSTFQSHCLRVRDELLYPSPPPPPKDKEDDKEQPEKPRVVTWSLNGVRSPPYPRDAQRYPQYTCPCINEPDWKATLEKNVERQFDCLTKWTKNSDRSTVLECGTLVRINPNGAGGVKQLVKFKSGRAVPLSEHPKAVAGGKWLEGRVVAHYKPAFSEAGCDTLSDHADFAGWQVGKKTVSMRSIREDVVRMDNAVHEQWKITPPSSRPLKARTLQPGEILDELGVSFRKWSKGLLLHNIIPTKPGSQERTWAHKLAGCTKENCQRTLAVAHSDPELQAFKQVKIMSHAGWTLTHINGRQISKEAKDMDWLKFVVEELKKDQVEMVFHAFPMWGDGDWAHPEGDSNAGAPKTGSLGVYEVEYDLDGRRDLVDFECVEPFPWTKLTVQRVSRLRVGEGKAENQIHALPFATGEVMQAMDMNQYATSDQAIKIPFLLNDFYATPDYELIRCNRRGKSPPEAAERWGPDTFWDHHVLIPPYRILGFPEWCYTRQLSMVGDMMGAAEWCFVTINQRVLSWPLRIRTHYGHPDFFDGYWSRTRGGTSKASPLVNTNEDIFAGYEMVGRGERGTYVEFLECHKGRETSFAKASVFEAKLAQGAAQQIRSIDVYMLNRKLDVFQRFGLFFASIAFYVTNMIMSISITYYILGIILFAMSGIQYHQLGLLDAVIAVPWLIQIGYVLAIPMIVELIIQKGFWAGIMIFIATLPISVVFFVFQMRTKTYFFLRGLIVGSGGYAATGRGFGLERSTMIEMYKSYSESHFTDGLMVFIALLVYAIYGSDPFVPYLCRTFTIIIIAISWLWAPIIFNPMPSTQELHIDLGVMVDWISTKLKKVRKQDAEQMEMDIKMVHHARHITLCTALLKDLERKAPLIRGGDGGWAATDRSAMTGGGGDTSRSDQSGYSEVSGISEGSAATSELSDTPANDSESILQLRRMIHQSKLEQEGSWFSALFNHNNREPACFSNVEKKDILKVDEDARSREIIIELLDIDGTPISRLRSTASAKNRWRPGTGSGDDTGGAPGMRNSRPSEEFMNVLFQKICHPLDPYAMKTDLGWGQGDRGSEREGGWMRNNPLLVIRCKDTQTHLTVMKSYREVTRLTDGVITIHPGELSDARLGPDRPAEAHKRIIFVAPDDLLSVVNGKTRAKYENYTDELNNIEKRNQLATHVSGDDGELKLEMVVRPTVTLPLSEAERASEPDIHEAAEALGRSWCIRPGKHIHLQEPANAGGRKLPLLFSLLEDGRKYYVCLDDEEYVPKVDGEPDAAGAATAVSGALPDYLPHVTLKFRLQTFDEWSLHRIPTFKDLTGLSNQYWISDDGKTSTENESWTAWWMKNVLFMAWESEDVFFSGRVNLIGNVLMKLYLHLEFYFPWVLMAFAFWRLDSVWYLILILLVGILFKMVDRNTREHHEYSQLLKALTLIAVPFAIIYFQHSLTTVKELFWSLVFYFLVVNMLTRGAMGFYNIRARTRSFGKSLTFRSFPLSDFTPVDEQSRGARAGENPRVIQLATSVKNRLRDMTTANEAEVKRVQVFTKRLLIPRAFGVFRRIIPFLVMLLLAIGNFLCVVISNFLMAIQYNGRVAEAWRRAYFRSSAAGAPPPAAGGGGGNFHAQTSAATTIQQRAHEDATNHGLGQDSRWMAQLQKKKGSRKEAPEAIAFGSVQHEGGARGRAGHRPPRFDPSHVEEAS